jgi:hypothetical protein
MVLATRLLVGMGYVDCEEEDEEEEGEGHYERSHGA